MLNINKIVELVDLSAETGANIKVNIHDFDYKKREEAFDFVQELQQALNVDFAELGAEKVSWFEIDIDNCNITVFFDSKFKEIREDVG